MVMDPGQKRDSPLSPEGYTQWILSVDESNVLLIPGTGRKWKILPKVET